MADSVIIDTPIGKSGECIASNVPKQLDVPVIQGKLEIEVCPTHQLDHGLNKNDKITRLAV
jgi:hypothetical protein